MKLFLDSADLDEIKDALSTGAIRGITTNPTLMARAGATDFTAHARAIQSIMPPGGVDLSIELPNPDAPRHDLERIPLGVTVKVPIRWGWLRLVRDLSSRRDFPPIPVNITACMTYNQGVLAASVGARYVSLFWNRIKDGGGAPWDIVCELRHGFDRDKVATEIIVGSIRKPEDVAAAFSAGAHIVTVPYAILKQMAEHPQTDIVVEQFMRDARAADPVHTP